MPILYESPKDVGADRIVNGIAAYEKYRDACIVVDFGTATTIDLISKKGRIRRRRHRARVCRSRWKRCFSALRNCRASRSSNPKKSSAATR